MADITNYYYANDHILSKSTILRQNFVVIARLGVERIKKKMEEEI